jgi:DNA-binding CsgD family transcriptional regulator/FtsZ-binding cell division protein ZapB
MAKKASPLSRAPFKEPRYLLGEIPFIWRIPHNNETEPEKLVLALRERIKELNCLYGISHLADNHPDSLDDFLKDMINLLPHSWQYPEITCARIRFQEKIYKTPKFKVSPWRQSSQIFMYGQPAGEVAIFYLEERPPADEGPFLKEERALLDAVAERIAAIAMRISAEEELQEKNRQLTLERTAIQETNQALRAVMARIEEEKQEIYKNIQANVDKVVMPILNALMLELPKIHRNYVELVKTQLDEITSPFIKKLSHQFHSLTPTEVEICNLIRNGLRTKEIAEMRKVSLATINRHREHIRRKLKITHSDVNLTTYLQSKMLGE